MHSIFCEDGPSSQSSTQMYSFTLSLLWLASNYCCLSDSSSRCDSNNAYSEFLRFKFWTSMLYSLKIQFSLNWIFTNKSLSSSSLKMFSEISSIRIEFSELFRTGFSVTLQTHTNTVPLTFLWHRFCSIDHRTFSFFSFSLSSNGFPIACFRCFLFEEQNHHEKRATQRIQTLWEHRIV